jgi:hypothetical protein
MRRLTIVMSGEERAALDKLANTELRSPRDYVRLLIRDVALSKGLLPKDGEGRTSIDRQERANEYTQ